MPSKLTLTVDNLVVDAAKEYAKRCGTSVSALVENYLRLTAAEEIAAIEKINVTPLVARLAGVGGTDVDINADPKEEWLDYLSAKHNA